MANFDFPFYDQPEQEKAKVTPIVFPEPTKDEWKDIMEEMFGGKK